MSSSALKTINDKIILPHYCSGAFDFMKEFAQQFYPKLSGQLQLFRVCVGSLWVLQLPPTVFHSDLPLALSQLGQVPASLWPWWREAITDDGWMVSFVCCLFVLCLNLSEDCVPANVPVFFFSSAFLFIGFSFEVLPGMPAAFSFCVSSFVFTTRLAI